MSSLSDRLKDDRALRDSAREVFTAELAHVKQEAKPSAIGERIANRLGRKVDAVSDKATDLAGEHGGKILAGAAAIAVAAGLWLARKPILSGLSALTGKGTKGNTGDRGEQLPEDADDE